MAYLPESYKNLPQNVKELILIKTNIGSYFFDAFIRVDHTSKLKVTEHPIESGSVVADHAYLEPKELIIEIGMSDAMQSLVPGQFSGGWSRSVTAYQMLLDLQATRTPLFIYTRLGPYNNMLITSISAPDDKNTRFGLKCSVTLREILVSVTDRVKVSAIPQLTDYNQSGQVLPQTVNESILYQLGLGNFGKNQNPTKYMWPVPGQNRVSSKFGPRKHPVTGVVKQHTGIDIPAPTGTPVVAAKSGVVIYSGVRGGYGNAVQIEHSDGAITLYGHNSALTVTKGQNVEQGQIIAKAGSTGLSTGPHCHFEIKKGGVYLDPEKYL